MNAVNPEHRMDLNEFMAWEATQAERHEFLDGEVFAMTGARDTHNTIALNLASHLRTALRGQPCRTFIADMKLRLDHAEASLYPDVMVTCDPRDLTPEAELAKRHPILVVEVLSESTAAYDYGRKFELYRSLDSPMEYALVDPDRPHVDLFRKDSQGRWVLYAHGADETVSFASLRVECTMARLYEDVMPGIKGQGD